MTAGKHRATRPRYGRLTALAASVSVVAVALVASAGGLDGSSDEADASGPSWPSTVRMAVAPTASASPAAGLSRSAGSSRSGRSVPPAPSSSAPAAPPASSAPPVRDDRALPVDSGAGRRVVFDQSAQRVWLVGDGGRVERTYLGSGSVIDNLHPGTYQVYSRSRWAVGVDDSGTMQYFVRFTRGPSGAAIGFHTIPTKNGLPLQRESQLGTPQSHGCIRQRTKDAIALWEFAPEGTKVVVVA